MTSAHQEFELNVVTLINLYNEAKDVSFWSDFPIRSPRPMKKDRY